MRLNLDFTACSSLLAMKNKGNINWIIQRNVFLLVWWVNYGGLYIKKPRKKKERGRGLFRCLSIFSVFQKSVSNLKEKERGSMGSKKGGRCFVWTLQC